MANELTGDYDVVAQFTIAAVNRVLAGMHRSNRFPHSLSVRVEDTPKSKRHIRVFVDGLGNSIADPVVLGQAGRSGGITGRAPVESFTVPNVDPVVNASSLAPNVEFDVFSQLEGIAQLQLGAPTISLPNDGSATGSVRTPAKVRYFPDSPFALQLPEFMRGEIVTSFEVASIFSDAGRHINVGLLGPAGSIHFDQIANLQPGDPLTADQLAAVNRCLRNSLTKGFLPSNAPLPAGVTVMDFKSLPGGQRVAALMSRQEGASPTPDSAETVFLHSEDQFALAVNGGSITGPFARQINEEIRRLWPPGKELPLFSLAWTSLWANVFVLDATVQLLDAANSPFAMGRIQVTVPVQIRFGWKNWPFFLPDPQNFDLTISQEFTLNVNSSKISVNRLGAVGFNPANIDQRIKTIAENLFINAWNSKQGEVEEQINAALSVAELQNFLTKLMNPAFAPKKDTDEQKKIVDVNPQLTYTHVEIKAAGIVMHGSLDMPNWPPPHVAIDLNPWLADTGDPEYSALNTWIPGGTIDELVWSFRGNPKPPDANRFVSSGPAIGWSPSSVCLTVKGSRLSSSGPVILERVAVSRCLGTTIPKAALKGFNNKNVFELPNIALQQPSLVPDFRGPVTGHASPWVAPGADATANFLIHYPDGESAARLELLTQALKQAERPDTVTAIVCVLTPEQVANTGQIEGVMFADDAEGWQRLFDVGSRPATVLLTPSGDVAWRRQGAIATGELAAALKQHLAPGGRFRPQLRESGLRIGQLAPNFLFESTPGLRLTLRKLAGRPVALLFSRSPSKPSLEMLRTLHKVAHQRAEVPVMLAIGGGGDGKDTGVLADELSAIVVPDPDQSISNAYGVSVWPTTIFLDAENFVEEIRYGLTTEEELRPRVEIKLPETDPKGKEYPC